MSRGSYYYQPRGESQDNQFYMRLLDEVYTMIPFYGVAKMTKYIRDMGYRVNPKRVRRLLRRMGLEAVYPKPRLSMGDGQAARFPYLLGGLEIVRPDQVWAADITYIRLRRGLGYLVAIMDWYSRYVLAWELSGTLETGFCLEALERALEHGVCEIFNSDQGCQFTSAAFTGRLLQEGVSISQDGRGRAFDNIMVERLWRSVKYEDVYLKDYSDMGEARRGIGEYLRFYNEERYHQSHGYRTPAAVYRQAA
jgi:putative transposase